MCRKAAIILALIGALALPASSGAVTIHRHTIEEVHHSSIIARDVDGPPLVREWVERRTVVEPVKLPPADVDQDGIADADDPCIGPCPVPDPVPTSSSSTTYTGGGYAIPESIVMCESGGNWSAVNPSSGAGGAYQILPSTWRLYGGSGAPQDASPAEQSSIASQIWADSGSDAWVC
jgi:hypothetical protein